MVEYENQVLQQMVLESFANFYGQISNDYLESLTQSDQAITEGVEDIIDAEANIPITRMALESSDAIVKDMLFKLIWFIENNLSYYKSFSVEGDKLMVGSGFYDHFKEMTEASPQIVYAVDVLNQMETLIKRALFDINEHILERTRERLLETYYQIRHNPEIGKGLDVKTLKVSPTTLFEILLRNLKELQDRYSEQYAMPNDIGDIDLEYHYERNQLVTLICQITYEAFQILIREYNRYIDGFEYKREEHKN